MKLRDRLLSQFEKPSGLLGRFTAMIMRRSNCALTKWMIEFAAIRQTDRVLEIGYGPGFACRSIARHLTLGKMVGIDHSKLMHRMATRRNRLFTRTKKLELILGSLDQMENQLDHFDIIFGINVHFFWNCPSKEFRKLYDLLKEDGRLLMVFQPRWARTADEINRVAEKCVRQFRQAGFEDISVEFKAMKPVAGIIVTGRRIG